MKYFSKKVTFQGAEFDSRKELDRYIVLKDMLRKGEIRGLERQKVFELLPKQVKHETIHLKTKDKVVEKVDEKAVLYHCDFFYFNLKTNQYVIEEIKSEVTKLIRDYSLRRKLVKLMIKKLNEEAGKELYVFNEIVK